MMKKMSVLALLSIFMCSCTDNAVERILLKPNRDPVSECPNVDSFLSPEYISISWKEDLASDIYMLMRKDDNSNGAFECVYEGNNTSYVDYGIDSGHRYVYRVDKRRGNKPFISDKYGYGFAAFCKEDDYENNDDEENATFLEADVECNLYCVTFKTGNAQIYDRDCFYVDIPPSRTICIKINQTGLSGTDECNILIQFADREPQSVNQGQEITISNTSYEKIRKYFTIVPDTVKLISAEGGQTVINYVLSLDKILKY